MKNSIWLNEETHYTLGDDFSLVKAASKEFSRFSAIYRNNNIWFRQSYERLFNLFEENNNCFWIKKDNNRIGGVIIEPNMMGWIYLIPPFCDQHKVMNMIVTILKNWSDPNKPIYAHGVRTLEFNEYFRNGFKLTSELCYFNNAKVKDTSWNLSCVMIRPTQKFEINFKESCIAVDVREVDQKELGIFFHMAFNNGKSKEYYESSCKAYLKYCNDVTINASTVLLNKTNGEIIGACLISVWEDWPNIYEVAVHPSYRGNGHASNMIKKALNSLHSEYPVLRLFVELGNDAQKLYHNLGFLAGEETTSLYIPINKPFDMESK